MKLYTTPEQTAKLIELGFAEPKGWYADGVTNNINLYVNIDKKPMMFNYSIGELIEMLPSTLPNNPYKPPLTFELNKKWRAFYGVQEEYSWEWSIWYEEECKELIDALFAMCVKLKEKRVIC